MKYAVDIQLHVDKSLVKADIDSAIKVDDIKTKIASKIKYLKRWKDKRNPEVLEKFIDTDGKEKFRAMLRFYKREDLDKVRKYLKYLFKLYPQLKGRVIVRKCMHDTPYRGPCRVMSKYVRGVKDEHKFE